VCQRPLSPREPATTTDWVQAFAAVIAAVMSTGAMLIALDTLRDQQRINTSQYRLNSLAQERTEQRYASRVAFWGSLTSAEIFIQNRSPVPLREVALGVGTTIVGGHMTLSHVAVDNIPPCVIVAISVTSIEPSIFNLDNAINMLSWLDVTFTDPNGHWKRDRNGLAKEKAGPSASSGKSRLRWTRQPVQDCGEGG
jgi:hypothetical protein